MYGNSISIKAIKIDSNNIERKLTEVSQLRDHNEYNPIESLRSAVFSNGGGSVIHPIISYPDGTEIVCSSVLPDGTVDVTIETPAFGGFKTAVFSLPSCTWKKKLWYTEVEIADFENYLKQVVDVIFEIAKEG